MRTDARARRAAFTRHVLDIVYVAAILALTALIALVARGVDRL